MNNARIPLIDRTKKKEETEVTITFVGPNHKDISKKFWGWFLDGGGAQYFAQVAEDSGYNVCDTYDNENKRWIVKEFNEDDE